MDRRSILKNAGIAGVLAAGVAPAVHAQATVRWRLASSFPKSLDTLFGGADAFARNTDNADTAATKSLAWRNSWQVPDFNRRVEAAVMERDAARRARLYQDLQGDFLKLSPFAILYQVVEVAGLRANVDGLVIGPTSESTHLFNVRKR